MVEKPKSLHVLGLENSSTEICGAKISQKRGKPVLDSLFSIDISKREEDDVKLLYIQSTGKSLSEVSKRYLIATSLPPSDVLVRSMDVNLKKAGDIDSVLAFQAEPLLPFPIDNAVIDRIILSKNEEGTRLTLLAAKKDKIEFSLEQWKKLQIEPEVITCQPAALADFSRLVYSEVNPLFVLHISRTQTICVLVKQGLLIASQMCSIHLGTLEAAFNRDANLDTDEARQIAFKEINWDNIDNVIYPSLATTLEQLQLELTRTFFSLGKQNKGVDIPDLLITGDCAGNYDLVFHLGHQLNKNVVTPHIPDTFNAPLPQVLKFAVPIGIALSCLPMGVDTLNFRQAELAYPNPWKRLKKPLAIYFALCLGLSAALYGLGEAYLGYEEDEVRADYANLLSVVQKPHTLLENEISKKGAINAAEQPLKKISIDQLKERLVHIDAELASTPDIYPLLPNLLGVSDILAWLNSQPTVASKDTKTGKLTPLIQIENLSYTMVKRPEVTKKNERYQVKVELEFSTPTPKEAREFHDALITPNYLIDPKGEVKWSTNRGKYRASFYLKDKTTYPTN